MIEIAICDDNEEDVEIIRGYVSDYMKDNMLDAHISVYHTENELLNSMRVFKIVFLSFSGQTGKNGVITGRELYNIDWRTKIIYTSASEGVCEQALNQAHAFACLHKPVGRETVCQQLEDALGQDSEAGQKDRVQFKIIGIANGNSVTTAIKVFNVEDIYYFQYLNRRIRIKSVSGEFYFVDSMKNVIAKMNRYGFEMCHQSYLVNLRHVKEIKGYNLYISDGIDVIPVAQRRSPAFREKLNEFADKMERKVRK